MGAKLKTVSYERQRIAYSIQKLTQNCMVETRLEVSSERHILMILL